MSVREHGILIRHTFEASTNEDRTRAYYIHASVDASEYERGAASPQANSLAGKTNAAGRTASREPDYADLH